MILSVLVLNTIHHSPFLTLSCCAGLFGLASYCQNLLQVAGVPTAVERDFEEDN